MDKNMFWNIIEKAGLCAGNTVQSGIGIVHTEIKGLDYYEILAFQRYFNYYKELGDRSLLMGVAALCMECENWNESEDVMDYFLDVVVFLGKSRYLRTLADPDSFCETFEMNLGEEYDVEMLNCLVYDLVAGTTPVEKYKTLCESKALTEAEIADIQAEIKFGANLDTEWKDVRELQVHLPKLYAMADQ